MSRLDSVSGKVMDLVGQVGDNLRTALPGEAGKWLQAGAAVGVARTGAKVAGGFARRHPAALAATAIGAGVLWFVVRRHAKKKQQAQGEPIEGKATRIEARRAAPRRRTARTASSNASSED